MFHDRAPGDRFFARIRALDIACPRCGEIYTVGEGRKGKDYVYDKVKGIFRCRASCGLVLAIGVLAWPMRPGRTGIPEDTIPNFREALRLRELMGLGGVLADEMIQGKDGIPVDQRHGGTEQVNVVIKTECRCQLVGEGRGKLVHPECPVHGEKS